ncbi:hypothetical protein C0993_008522 [Termitomyces sp. T159_Od127]|nr:hypothetical protein C0993_008522 [Termitomyces sp. T159_Od127]
MLPASSPMMTTDAIIQHLWDIQETIHPTPAQHIDPRIVSPFLQSTGWLYLLDNQPSSSLIDLVSLPHKTEFPHLVDAVHLLFDDGEQIFNNIPELVLQRLASPDPVKQGISNTPFKTLQNHKAGMRKYTYCIIRLLAMLLRDSNILLYDFTQQQKKHILKLRDGLEQEPVKQLSMRVHRVLVLLWTQTWYRSNTTSFPDPTINCLALMSLQNDGSFKDPKYITGPIAQFEYCMRFVFMIEIHRRKSLDQNSTHEKHCEDLCSWFTEKFDSTFNSLRSLQHRASTVAQSTMSLPTVWWLDRENYRTMAYKGNRIEFDDIKKLFVRLEAEIIELFEKKILCGLSLHVTYQSIADDLSNPTVGYSFISDSRNPSFTNKDLLMRAILDSPALSSRFVASHAVDASPIWNIIAFRTWLHEYAKFHGLLLLRAEMLGGSPARGTELTAMTYKNIPTSSHRNLVAFGKHIAMLVTYHKGTAMTGLEKLIPHSLDAISSDLIIQDLVIARPFAQIAAMIAYSKQPKIWDLYSNYMFINDGALFETHHISNLMRVLTSQTIQADLGLQAWRQISIAFRRKTCRALEEVMETDQADNIEAMQATHSRWTENRVYGLSADALAGVAEDVLPLYLEASTQWQIATGAVPGGLALPYFQARTDNYADLVEKGLIPRSPSSQPVTLDKIVSDLVPNVIQALQPALIQAIDASVKEILAKRPRCLPVVPSPTPMPPQLSQENSKPVVPFLKPSLSDMENADLQALALKGLRLALQNPNADWSCTAQKDAVTAVLSCEADICAILRTGAGKTMLAIIPALVETNKVTIVVLPLKSLVSDYSRKLTAMNIPFELYTGINDHEITGRHNLILISADRIRRESWRQTLEIVNCKKPVQRLIFDEAHYPLIDYHFRSSLDNVHEIRTLPFQIVLLSATVPPQCRNQLCKLFGFVSLQKTISMPTDRPELQYQFQNPIKDHGQRCQIIVNCINHEMASFKPEERALVFVSLKDVEGRPLSQDLQCDFYHGNLNDHDRQAAYNRWVQGVNKIMVCTNAFGAGNDYPHVRLIIHAGTPRHMVTYVQEVGRGGRDGQPTKCILFPRAPGVCPREPTNFDPKGEHAFWKMLFQSDQCIRHSITSFMDGLGVSCIQSHNAPLCSRCQAMSSPSPPSSEPAKRKSDEAFVQFQMQSISAKKSRLTRNADQIRYSSHLLEMLDKFSTMCALCYLFNQESDKHFIIGCPLLEKGLEGFTVPTYLRWQTSLRYAARSGPAICYFCHIPQLDDTIHGEIRKGGAGCVRKDILAPVAFGIFHQVQLREAASSYFGCHWMSIQSYGQWLTERTVTNHTTNMLAAFMWYAEKIDERGIFNL